MTTAEKDITKAPEATPEKVERTSEGAIYRPDVDIVEKAEGIELSADMPGVDEKSLDITFEDGTLTIHGKVDVSIPEGFCVTCGEYGVGDYHRAFKVSEQIDAAGISACITDGVLRLWLPKAERARPRKIQITAGA